MSWEITTPTPVPAGTELNSPDGAITAPEWDAFNLEFIVTFDTDFMSAFLYVPNSDDSAETGARYRIQQNSTFIQIHAAYQLVGSAGYVIESTNFIDLGLSLNDPVTILLTRSSASEFNISANGNNLHNATHTEVVNNTGIAHFGNVEATAEFTIQSLNMNAGGGDPTSLSPGIIGAIPRSIISGILN